MILLTDNFPQHDARVCLFAQHQTIVIGQKLYVDGGVYRTQGGIDDINYRDIRIYDLSTMVRTAIDGRNVSLPQMQAAVRPASITNAKLGYLWTDPSQRYIFRYGGNLLDGEDNAASGQAVTAYGNVSAIVGFDTQLDIGSASAWYLPPGAAPPNVTRLANGAGARLVNSYVGYYLGGVDDNIAPSHVPEGDEPTIARNDLVIWQGTDNSWINQTVTEKGPKTPTFNPGTGGVLINIPIGDKGMLVSLGGIKTGSTSDRLPMDRIRVYDILSGSWYTQAAIGDIPDPRNNFCGVLGSASDNSSYNIYISGGQTGIDTGADDVYILSIPSFRWVKVYSGNNIPRAYHTCEVIQNQQMAIIGGYNSSTLDRQHCAQDMGGDLLIYNMNSLQFTDYNPGAGPYLVPSAITAFIGGSGTGNAKVGDPAAGWTDPLFKSAYQNAANAWQTTQPLLTAPGPGPPSPSGLKPHAGALAGGIVGGSAGLALLLAIVFFMSRRYRRQRSARVTLLVGKDESPFPTPKFPSPSNYPSSSGQLPSVMPRDSQSQQMEIPIRLTPSPLSPFSSTSPATSTVSPLPTITPLPSSALSPLVSPISREFSNPAFSPTSPVSPVSMSAFPSPPLTSRFAPPAMATTMATVPPPAFNRHRSEQLLSSWQFAERNPGTGTAGQQQRFSEIIRPYRPMYPQTSTGPGMPGERFVAPPPVPPTLLPSRRSTPNVVKHGPALGEPANLTAGGFI